MNCKLALKAFLAVKLFQRSSPIYLTPTLPTDQSQQAVGISVEFCAHIVSGFACSHEKSRVQRAKSSLAVMGSSVSLFAHAFLQLMM